MKAFMVMKELVVITRGRERSWLVRRAPGCCGCLGWFNGGMSGVSMAAI